MENIKEVVKHALNIKPVRRLGTGQGKVYALEDRQGNVISNFDDVVKAAEEFYTCLYSTSTSHATFIRSSDEEDTEAPSITSDEVKSALQAMTEKKREQKIQ